MAFSSPVTGCGIEYAPEIRSRYAHRRLAGASVRVLTDLFDLAVDLHAMRSVHGGWNAMRCGPWSIATSGAILRHSAVTISIGSRANSAIRCALAA